MLATSSVDNNAGQIIQTQSHDGSSAVFDYNEASICVLCLTSYVPAGDNTIV